LPLTEDQCLPEQRLQLETLTESQIISREHAARSLKELFEYSDDCSTFLTEAAYSDLSQPDSEASPDPVVSYEGQADGSITLPGSCILEPDGPSIVSYTDYLLSPTNYGEMGRFGENLIANSLLINVVSKIQASAYRPMIPVVVHKQISNSQYFYRTFLRSKSIFMKQYS